MIRKAGAPARPWIDTVEFARARSSLSGRVRVAGLPRLADMLADDRGELEWKLDGERRPRAEGGADSFLRLSLAGSAVLSCVRCLEPVECPVAADRLFKIAATETQAEREDAESEDFDVLAASPRFDVLGLVEDEAIMALPIAPRHERCGLPAGGGAAADEAPEPKRPNPFEVLRGLAPRAAGTGAGAGEIGAKGGKAAKGGRAAKGGKGGPGGKA